MPGIQLPSKIRFLSNAEYRIVSRVFGDTLPWRVRILVTNAAGVDGRPFTIPTSLLPTIVGSNPATFLSNVSLGYLSSFVNLAYLINAGTSYDLLVSSEQALLVHEMTHVWQGKNSTFALTYVFNSVYNQCVKGNAYSYVAGRPWSDYNAEQQASIVEDWFSFGESTTSPLYHYITENVRTVEA